MQPVFLSAEWRKLIIANYEVDPSILLPYLPLNTELDLFNGKCLVSLVGFRFLNTRLRGFRIPFHRNFEEINLRFYVRFKENGIWKRGVTFIKEIVPKYAISFVANNMYNEKYITLPTRHIWTSTNETQHVSYQWKHKGKWDSLEVFAESEATDFNAGSEEEFITEHYWGFTQVNKHRTSAYQVDHPKWKMYNVNSYTIDTRFSSLYGKDFECLNNAKPHSVMLAEGSPINVYVKNKINIPV